MTEQARYNLLKGIEENKINKHTTYNIENELDAYILQRQKIKDKVFNRQEKEILKAAAAGEIAAAAAKEIDKAFKNIISY